MTTIDAYITVGAKPWVVFGAMCLLDFVWARYIDSMVRLQIVYSGLWAAALIILSGTVTLGYTSDPNMLLPAALGAFVGTTTAVWRNSVKAKRGTL